MFFSNIKDKKKVLTVKLICQLCKLLWSPMPPDFICRFCFTNVFHTCITSVTDELSLSQ